MSGCASVLFKRDELTRVLSLQYPYCPFSATGIRVELCPGQYEAWRFLEFDSHIEWFYERSGIVLRRLGRS